MIVPIALARVARDDLHALLALVDYQHCLPPAHLAWLQVRYDEALQRWRKVCHRC